MVNTASYTLTVKKPGSDEQRTYNVDLVETFNYLIGLRLVSLAAPHHFTAYFTRKPDPELPADPADPNNGQKERVLIIWRKLAGDLEKDSAHH